MPEPETIKEPIVFIECDDPRAAKMSMLVDAFGMKALALEATENEVFSALSTIIVATWHDADDELFGMIFDGLRRSVLSCRAERSRREAVRAGRKMS